MQLVFTQRGFFSVKYLIYYFYRNFTPNKLSMTNNVHCILIIITYYANEISRENEEYVCYNRFI